MSGGTAESLPAPVEKSVWWRAVLGEYVTGVCLITSRDESGHPIAMVVGSFVAVSEDPPLVGFFAANSSTTLPQILKQGSFTVSVLGSNDEDLCRAFARKDSDRWSLGRFGVSPAGNPRLADAVAWFDVDASSAEFHGDHRFVVGHVQDFGVGEVPSGMPLLFRRAGYGSFAAPSASYDFRAFIDRLRWVSMREDLLTKLVADLGLPVTVLTQLGDSVVTLADVLPSRQTGWRDRVGAAFPFAAPIAPVFAAWASPAQQRAWEEASRHLVGSVDRQAIARQLSGVRERGYSVAGDANVTRHFLDMLRDGQPERSSFARVWADLAETGKAIDRDDGLAWDRISGVQVPVRDSSGGVLLSLAVTAPAPFADRDEVETIARRMSRAGAAMSDWDGALPL